MHKRLILLFALVLAASLLLSACAPAEVTEQPGQEPAAPVNPAQARGNVLTIGDFEPEGKFNPILANTVYDIYMVELMFDPLMGMEPDGTLVADGGLAERWEVSEDGKQYTFFLREGVKFHDGTELTAEDVAFTLDMIMHPEYDGALFYLVENIVGAKERQAGTVERASGIEIIDPLTIRITVEEATAKTLRDLNVHVMSKAYYSREKYTDFVALTLAPMGTGPFKFEKYEVGQYVELVANENYWDGRPQLDGIIYKVVSPEAQIAEFEVGSVDAVNFTGTDENYTMVSAVEHGNIIEFMNNGYAYIGFNLRDPLFSDVRVRQALTYGLDREGFVQSFFKGRGHVAHTPISPVSWAYPDLNTLNQYQYNPDRANELLDEAGWVKGDDGWRYKDGQRLAFTWTTYSGVAWVDRITALAKENWKLLGVDVTIDVLDFNTVVQRVYDEQNFQMFNMAWGLTADPDMSGIFSVDNSQPGGNNAGGYHNPELEELMRQGILELDQERRKEIYHEIARIFNNDLPYIFVYIRNNYWAVNDRVQNFVPSEFINWTQNAHEISVTQ